jgi:hypothetical protein
MTFTFLGFLVNFRSEVKMSLESSVGRVTNDVLGAISDNVTANLALVLKNEMKLSDDQVLRATSIVKSTIESVGYNGVNQYVSLFKELQTESPKKMKLFG